MRDASRPSHTTLTMHPSATAVTCRDIPGALWEYIDGALDAARASAIRTHLANCAPCGARYDEARRLLQTVSRAGQEASAPDSLRERVDALLREHGFRA